MGGRLKMALSLSLAHNFNQKLANLNDKWNDFSFMLKSNATGKGGGMGGAATRNDSYHSIESAVTCTAADLEAGNLSGGGGGGRIEDDRKGRYSSSRKGDGGGGSSGLWDNDNSRRSHRQQQRHRSASRSRLSSPRRNSASGDTKEFDMLVLNNAENVDDNESF